MHSHTRNAPWAKVATALTALCLSGATVFLGPQATAAGSVNSTTAEPVLGSTGAATPDVVHLITGHEVEIATAADGIPQVTASFGSSTSQDLKVHAEGTPGEAPELTAQAPEALDLLAQDRIDPHLFDLNYLIDHGFGDKATPVTVHFEDPVAADDVAAVAERLPGSTLVPGSADTERATVSVPAESGATFWNAVTTPPSDGADLPSLPRRFVKGIAGLTLDGAELSSTEDAGPTGATSTLTIRVHGPSDRSRWAIRRQAVFLPRASFVPVTGAGQTESLSSNDFVCEGAQCQTAVASIELPDGVWSVEGTAPIWVKQFTHWGHFHEPEVQVEDGASTLDLYMDDLEAVDLGTPRVSELAWSAATYFRTRPNGTYSATLAWSHGDRGNKTLVMAPTQRPATTGAFNVMVNPILQEPRISLTVTEPKTDLALHAQYPNEVGLEGSPPYLTEDVEGADLVDVGFGYAEDFEQVDANGNVLLVAVDPAVGATEGCRIPLEVYQRADEAGAVALVIDTDDSYLPVETPSRCNMPFGPVYGADMIPVTYLPQAESVALRGLLEQGPVTLAVHSPENQRLRYLYELAKHFNGGIPEGVEDSFRVTDDELAVRTTRVHGSAGMGAAPGEVGDHFGAAKDVWQVIAAGTGQFSLLAGNKFANIGQANRAIELTEYVQPSHDVRWTRSFTLVHADRPSQAEYTTKMVTSPSTKVVDWFAPGRTFAPKVPTIENEAWPAPPYTCSFCRVDDVLYGTPRYLNGAEPQHESNGTLSASLTDESGTEIPLTPVNYTPAFRLPAETQRYTLTGTGSHGETYKWTFTSGTGDDSNRSPEVSCLIEHALGLPCGEPVPIVYLRYETPVDIDNLAPAGSKHTVEVTAFHQAENAAPITSLTTQVSFDGGATWQDAKGGGLKSGARSVRFTVPALADTDGYVALRTVAADADGNTSTLTYPQVYALR